MQSLIQTKFVSSILWSLATRWGAKLIGMIATIVLARLLTPEDFGLVAMTSLLILLLDSITQVGINLYLLRHKQDDERVYNTAWTVNILQGVVISLLMVACAPFLADFYNQPALRSIVFILAIGKLIEGLKNIGIWVGMKNLQFSADFNVTITERIGYLISTIIMAMVLGNFWAIVYGQLIAICVSVLASYYFHPYRPRLAWYQGNDIVRYAKTIIPFSFGRYLNNNAHTAVLGKFTSASVLGGYHVAVNLSCMFTKELLMPIMRGLAPNLALLKDSESFNQVYRMTLALAVYLFLPIGAGLFSVSDELILVILGSQWSGFSPILAWMGIYLTLSGILMFSSEQILILLHREKLTNQLMWFRNLILATTLYLVFVYSDYQLLPKALCYSMLISFPIVLWVMARQFKLSIIHLVSLWWPPIVASGVMIWVLKTAALQSINSIVLLLTLKVIIGVFCYLAVISLLYFLRSKPSDSPETQLLNKFIYKRSSAS